MNTRNRAELAPLPLALAAALALAGPARAGLGAWTPLGPDGAFVQTLAASPSQPAIVLAGTSGGGAFRSGDGGRSWTPSSTGLTAKGLFGISTFEFDPFRPQTVFAATFEDGVYRSADGGRTWEPVGPGLPPSATLNGTPAYALESDPFNAGALFAGTQNGVFRSLDRGGSWAARRTGLPNAAVTTLAFDPAGRVLYAGVLGFGLFKSTNRGGRWLPANAGLPLSIHSLGFDPRSPSVVFAGTTNGLYRSLDRGGSWVRLGTSLIRTGVPGVGFLESTGTLFAASGTGVFESLDRGTTWRRVFTVAGGPFLQVFTLGQEALYLATNRHDEVPALLRSTDGGVHWEEAGRGLAALAATGFTADPVSPRIAYAVLDFFGLFKTTDRGATWKRLPLDFSTFHLGDLAIDPLHPETIYAAAPFEGPLVRSDDGGATWRRPANAPFERAEALALDPRHPGGLWLGGADGVAYTPDGGSTFTLLDPEGSAGVRPWIQDIAVDPANPATVYLAGGLVPPGQAPGPGSQPRLYRSLDGGATWSGLPPAAGMGSILRQVALDPEDPGALYAASDRALFRTGDDGIHWSRLFDLGGLPGSFVFAPGRLYASHWLKGIQVSRDHGRTWKPLRAGLGARPVTGLWLDPHDPSHLFAGTSNGGLYEYTLPP